MSGHSELFDRICPQVKPKHTAWSRVGIVVDAGPVEDIVVLLRSPTGDADLRSETALTPAGVGIAGIRLCLDRVDAGLQGSDLSQISSIGGKGHSLLLSRTGLEPNRRRPRLAVQYCREATFRRSIGRQHKGEVLPLSIVEPNLYLLAGESLSVNSRV